MVGFDRSVASSLVLQGLDGLSAEVVWQLNHDIYRPDLSIILNGDPKVIGTRLRARGRHSRFERAEDNSDMETVLYVHAVVDLQARGLPVATRDEVSEVDASSVPNRSVKGRRAIG